MATIWRYSAPGLTPAALFHACQSYQGRSLGTGMAVPGTLAGDCVADGLSPSGGVLGLSDVTGSDERSGNSGNSSKSGSCGSSGVVG